MGGTIEWTTTNASGTHPRQTPWCHHPGWLHDRCLVWTSRHFGPRNGSTHFRRCRYRPRSRFPIHWCQILHVDPYSYTIDRMYAHSSRVHRGTYNSLRNFFEGLWLSRIQPGSHNFPSLSFLLSKPCRQSSRDTPGVERTRSLHVPPLLQTDGGNTISCVSRRWRCWLEQEWLPIAVAVCVVPAFSCLPNAPPAASLSGHAGSSSLNT